VNWFSMRFGNSFLSRGSAIPISLKQIANRRWPRVVDRPGGNSAQPILHVLIFDDKGSKYVLEMDKPLRIGVVVDGVNRLSRREMVIYLQPGGKLEESLLAGVEFPTPTAQSCIMKVAGPQFVQSHWAF